MGTSHLVLYDQVIEVATREYTGATEQITLLQYSIHFVNQVPAHSNKRRPRDGVFTISHVRRLIGQTRSPEQFENDGGVLAWGHAGQTVLVYLDRVITRLLKQLVCYRELLPHNFVVECGFLLVDCSCRFGGFCMFLLYFPSIQR